MKKFNVLIAAMFLTFGVYAQTVSETEGAEVKPTTATSDDGDAPKATAVKNKEMKKAKKVKVEDADSKETKPTTAKEAKTNKGSEISALAKQTESGPGKGQIISAAASGDKHVKTDKSESNRPEDLGQNAKPEKVKTAGRPTRASAPARKPMKAHRPANGGKH
ncbi:MAG TPA: hypothetical protein VF691_21315 [Cytophagaceae bacterium]|jgi:hypothetical protein